MNLLDGAIVTLSAFAGLVMENTTRGPGWHFLEIGRRLERARYMAELLQAGVAEAPEEIEPYLRILLYIADSSITYRTRYLTALRTDLVLDLLLAGRVQSTLTRFSVRRSSPPLRKSAGARRHCLSFRARIGIQSL